MSVAKITEISSSSSKSYDDAISSGIARANKTLNGIKSAWVKDHQVSIKDGKVTEFKPNVEISF